MSGGIFHGESCSTLMTANSSDNGESIFDEDSRKNSLNSVAKMSRNEEEVEEGVQDVLIEETDDEDEDSKFSKNPLNSTYDSTLDCSFEGKTEMGDEETKSDDEGMVCGPSKRGFYYGLAAVLLLFVMTASVSSAVIVTSAALPVVTQAPTQSLVPSTSPTVTQTPSTAPTSSMVPSDQPSHGPTTTFRPSQMPSTQPTLSLVPSFEPTTSMLPSMVPSVIPTDTQAPSIEPTFTPIDPEWRFKLRLYWENSYFWQEEAEERFWCMGCVNCTEYGRGDWWEHGCESYENGLNTHCMENDSVWIRDCRNNGNEFNVIQKERSGYQLRLHNSNLCIDRRNKHLRLRKCDIKDLDQLFVPWHDFTKFELRPLVMEGMGEREADCVSQLHHPKDKELVGMHNCRLSRIYETRYWEIYK